MNGQNKKLFEDHMIILKSYIILYFNFDYSYKIQ